MLNVSRDKSKTGVLAGCDPKKALEAMGKMALIRIPRGEGDASQRFTSAEKLLGFSNADVFQIGVGWQTDFSLESPG